MEVDHFERFARNVNGLPEDERNQFLAIRKEAGLRIDPATAEVAWGYANPFDPYAVFPLAPEGYDQFDDYREYGYFARAPGSDVWIWCEDLPEATAKALWATEPELLLR